MPAAGTMSYLNYALESSYGSAGSPMVAAFGIGQTITSQTSKNNMERVFQLGNRNAVANVAKRFEGALTTRFVLSSPWFWRLVLGSPIETSSNTHTFREANSIPSFTIENGMNLGTDICRQFIGAYVDSMTLTANVNELARVSLDCPYSNESASSTIASSPISTPEDGLHFAQGTLTLGGSTIANVQSFELTINNNAEQVWGLGSRVATVAIPKQREYGITMSIAVDNPVLLHKFYGGATGPSASTPPAADLKLTFTNNAGTQPSSMSIVLGSVFLDTDSISQDPNEIIKENVVGWALYCGSVVAVDTNTPPHG